MSYGIFMGYRLQPGGRWNGEYMVKDINDFMGIPLHMEAPYNLFKRKPHITKKVEYGSRKIHFPLKERYEWYNNTLAGRELAYMIEPTACVDDIPGSAPPGGMPPLLSNSADKIKREIVDQSCSKDETGKSRVKPQKTSDGVGHWHLREGKDDDWGYYENSRGYFYPLDCYHNIIRRSRRPPFIDVSEWNKWPEKRKVYEFDRWNAMSEEAISVGRGIAAMVRVDPNEEWHNVDELKEKVHGSARKRC